MLGCEAIYLRFLPPRAAGHVRGHRVSRGPRRITNALASSSIGSGPHRHRRGRRLRLLQACASEELTVTQRMLCRNSIIPTCEPPRTEIKTARNTHRPAGSPSVHLARGTHSARGRVCSGRPFTPLSLARWQSGRDLLLLGLRMPCLVAATPITRGRGAKARSRYAGRVRRYATGGAGGRRIW